MAFMSAQTGHSESRCMAGTTRAGKSGFLQQFTKLLRVSVCKNKNLQTEQD
ncbi:uncharacterized protein ASCRUDRAFT_98918 [Ascoidea rubescens DSM 1968]|uniref:Uncharacterized protein n=1 Tax=Ascoidea rubescens DSM 1968 TaxID=1344418 RepID=A0A1D2VQB1_9ASCO|nr:hypothetical protein ASCRUDRAFT_98918 [Ascoidea rubescens DSM 1968]ODV63796.1 hypothetical protein ASCRUDRAFT_98918 [Ascoidea rubescens DSM 1968]